MSDEDSRTLAELGPDLEVALREIAERLGLLPADIRAGILPHLHQLALRAAEVGRRPRTPPKPKGELSPEEEVTQKIRYRSR